jgi:hypothetical protein
MHGPITTAGKIDAFEARFTIVGGAHFLIAPNGKEAWPISAAEADAFKALYRRRMQGALAAAVGVYRAVRPALALHGRAAGAGHARWHRSLPLSDRHPPSPLRSMRSPAI